MKGEQRSELESEAGLLNGLGERRLGCSVYRMT